MSLSSFSSPSPGVLWRLDMHCHTSHSPDCFTSPAAFARAAARAGLDAVFVTDHERVSGAAAVEQAAAALGHPLRVFPGQEIHTRCGELIGLFVREPAPPGLTPGETIERLHAQGALVYLPHPFARLIPSRLSRSAVLGLADRFDVIEVANSRNILRRDDRRAADFACAHGLLAGAGSDAHWPWEVGRTYVELPPFDSPESLRASLWPARVVDRAKTSYVLCGFNAAIYPLRELWWRLTGDRRDDPRMRHRFPLGR